MFILIRKKVFLLLSIAASHVCAQDTLMVGTYTYGSNNRIEQLSALANYLEKETGYPIKTKSYASVKALREAILLEEVNLAMFNTTGFIKLQQDTPGAYKVLVNLTMGEKESGYGACIFVNKNSKLNQLEDLKDKHLAFVSPSSTTGNLVPRLLLQDAGLELNEKNIYYAGTHIQAVQAVATEKADAGACGCNSVTQEVKVIAKYNNTPLGPFLVNRSLSKEKTKKLKRALLVLHQKDEQTFQTWLKGWSEFESAKKFQVIGSNHYKKFESWVNKNPNNWLYID